MEEKKLLFTRALLLRSEIDFSTESSKKVKMQAITDIERQHQWAITDQYINTHKQWIIFLQLSLKVSSSSSKKASFLWAPYLKMVTLVTLHSVKLFGTGNRMKFSDFHKNNVI